MDKKDKDRGSEGQLAEEILETFGFGGLVDLLKGSEVFKHRLEEVNQRIKENMKETKDKGSQVDFDFSVSSLQDRISSRKRASRPLGRSEIRDPSSQWGTKEKKESHRRAPQETDQAKREPLVDLFEEDGETRIIALLPSLERKDDLTLQATGNTLVLRWEDYRHELQLSHPVESEPEVKFNKGILDIRFQQSKTASNGDESMESGKD